MFSHVERKYHPLGDGKMSCEAIQVENPDSMNKKIKRKQIVCRQN